MSSPFLAALAALAQTPEAQALIKSFATELAKELRGGASADLVSQHGSPLGRRHNAAVRRRQARGEPGAHIVGRVHYLTREALAAELGSPSERANDKPQSPVSDVRANLERRLRAVAR